MNYIVVAVSPFYNGRGWTDQATGISFEPSVQLRQRRIDKAGKDLSGIKNSVRMNNLLLIEGDLSDAPEKATKVNPEELTKEQFRAMVDILQAEASDDETVGRLRQERDDAISNAEALELQISSKDSQINTLESTVSSLESDKTDLEGQVADLEADKASLQAQVDDLQAQLDAIGDEGTEAGIQSMSLGEDNLSDKTKAELKEIADEKGINYTSSDTKQDIINKIQDANV